ncbi:MAG: hypothetical protein LBS72_03640 [Oscillospiraceae bacterium]|jgi:hypothetical protein|nr:hypothetical protein [Oscillospiraceae bacterium]
MKKALAGVGASLGLIAALLGLAVRFLPIYTIVGAAAWLGFLENALVLEPYWLTLTIAGGAVALGLGALFFLLRRRQADAEASEPAPIPLDQIYRADNLDIRARVRDLLHRAWGGPLLALLLGALPIAAVHGGVYVFLNPFQKIYEAIKTPFDIFAEQMGDVRVALALIASGTLPDFSGTPEALLKCAPGLIVLMGAGLLAFNPMRVSRADYFTRLLFGRRPSPLDAYGCFVKSYERALGGMAYHSLWLTIWGALFVAAPPAIYIGGVALINRYPEQATPHLLVLFPALIALTVVAFVALGLRLINRWLAYSLAPCLIATQKNLTARRAMRASRWLMRGRKTRLFGMWMSFLYYFLPAIGSLILLPLVTPLGNTFGFTEYLSQSLRRFFIVVAALNQLLLVYVAPVAYASFYAFYLEMKRDFRDRHPTLLYIIGMAKPPQSSRQRNPSVELKPPAPDLPTVSSEQAEDETPFQYEKENSDEHPAPADDKNG